MKVSSVVLAVVLALVAARGAWACPAGSFVTAAQLSEMRSAHPELVVVDARSPKAYAAGHIPGAINLPPDAWRTPSVKPGRGDSQYIFRASDGSVDVARYEKMLGEAGITRETPVVVYGEHAGKADGSIPAMILDLLGHEKVCFLDGVGAEQWVKSGGELSTEPAAPRAAAAYVAEPKAVVWNLDDVLERVGDAGVVFYDTRSPAEFSGEDLRGNARGGRIPGAVLCDYEEMLRADGTTVSAEEAKRLLEARGITPDKTVVLYCQTATRVSLPYLKMKDLGYGDVRVYDASWHEYGNRPDTPVETGSGEVVGGEAVSSGASR